MNTLPFGVSKITRGLILYAVVLVMLPMSAAADTITFKTGFTKDVIIENETPESIKFRKRNKVVSVSRENIVNVEYATPEENEEIQRQWAREKEQLEEERRKRQQERQRSGEEKKDRDLLKIEDKWVTPEKLQEMWEPAAADQPAPRTREEIHLPEFVKNLPDELRPKVVEKIEQMPEAGRKEYLETLRQVTVHSVSVWPAGTARTTLQAVVVNRSEYPAKQVVVGILCLDENGNILYLKTQTLRNVRAKQSKTLTMQIRVNYVFIEDLIVRVVDLM
ncbi:MAG: hypothetical protein JSV16_14010 [Candidatus Hydrogenedentota bacterium]|nr:MAG: hypothetical protein JSV16_14010 [Candidatus Hydrogenedentota bacterium]